MAIKGYRLYIYISIQQLCAPHLGAGAAIQNILGCFGKVHPQILNAILIPAAVGDFSGVDGKGLLQIFHIAAHASGATL
jgi:hypothetical protein